MRGYRSTAGYRFNASLCRYTTKSDPEFEAHNALEHEGPAFLAYTVLLEAIRENLFTEEGPKANCAPYIVRLYGSSKRLDYCLVQMRDLFSSNLTVIQQPNYGRRLIRLDMDAMKIVAAVFSALRDFDLQIFNLITLIVDLNYPGLSHDLASAPADEDKFPQLFVETIVPRYQLTPAQLTPWLLAFFRSFETYWGIEPQKEVLGNRYHVENDPSPFENEYLLVDAKESAIRMCDTLAEPVQISAELLHMSRRDEAIATLDRRLPLLATEIPPDNDSVRTTANPTITEVSIGELDAQVLATANSTIPDIAVSVLDELREACQSKQPSPTDVGLFIKLYGSVVRLASTASELIALVSRLSENSSQIAFSTDETERLSLFFQELIDFDRELKKINLFVIDIYYPGLSEALLDAVGHDISFHWYYENRLQPKYYLREQDFPISLVSFLETFNMDVGYRNHRLLDEELLGVAGRSEEERYRKEMADFFRSDQEASKEEVSYDRGQVQARMISIRNALVQCRTRLAHLVRDTWDFTEIVKLRHKGQVNLTIERGGITAVKNQYNIDRSQVGAIGPGAQATDMQFNQAWDKFAASHELSALATELGSLRERLQQDAKERDHYEAIVTVADAEEAAKGGDGVRVFRLLSKLGTWVLDVATKIGVSVAAEAIKQSTGFR